MPTRPRNNVPSRQPGGAGPLDNCLSIDLEVGKDDGRIHKFAGVRPDTGQPFAFPQGRGDLALALARLDQLAEGAGFLLGHNLIAFDLPYLQAANPGLNLLQLPSVDTLMLNPLAFPATLTTIWSSTIRTASLSAGESTTRSSTPDLHYRSSQTSRRPCKMSARTC